MPRMPKMNKLFDKEMVFAFMWINKYLEQIYQCLTESRKRKRLRWKKYSIPTKILSEMKFKATVYKNYTNSYTWRTRDSCQRIDWLSLLPRVVVRTKSFTVPTKKIHSKYNRPQLDGIGAITIHDLTKQSPTTTRTIY